MHVSTQGTNLQKGTQRSGTPVYILMNAKEIIRYVLNIGITQKKVETKF